MRDGKAAEDDVAEQVPAQVPHRGHHPAHAERRADLFGLSGAGRTGADHFLQRDDVGVDLAQDFGDPLRRGAAIHAAAAVNVVGGDSEVDDAGLLWARSLLPLQNPDERARRSSPTAAAAASAPA